MFAASAAADVFVLRVQGIKEHPWYTKELPPFLQDALDTMAKEQVGTTGLAGASHINCRTTWRILSHHVTWGHAPNMSM
jgi:hypothetical protein